MNELNQIITNDTDKFKWDKNKEDRELYMNGIVCAWFAGRTTSIQRLVEELSYKTGHKCDFSWFSGRAHIDVMPEGVNSVTKLLNDEIFMKDFIVPYSRETYDNGTYLERIG